MDDTEQNQKGRAQEDQQFIALPANRLLAKFGAGGHKPGSGSAAALLGLVACKLIQTVVTLSNGRDEYIGVRDQLTLANTHVSDDIEPFLLDAIQKDAVLFNRVIVARRKRDRARTSSKKKKLAGDALSELREATDLPLEIAEKCLEVAEHALTVFDLGYKAARGDAGVALSAALSGAAGALSVVFLNLTSFRGGKWAQRARAQADGLLQRVHNTQIDLFTRLERLQTEVLEKERPNAT